MVIGSDSSPTIQRDFGEGRAVLGHSSQESRQTTQQVNQAQEIESSSPMLHIEHSRCSQKELELLMSIILQMTLKPFGSITTFHIAESLKSQ